ncbi:TPA: hypothetical protein G8B71_004643 [Salmonella enterica]|uniref:DUF6884 domain-containing protein n=1 Tax=Enterobacter asburiae TaxID=61645 RepID=UPI0007A49A89|nr:MULTISPECIES: DUF6884 domain-containing protein [Enterobacter cloacae complex]KZB17230.1 hypothetical protein AOX72_16900 [Salmonella enterica subsp. enterica serovar Derby]HAF3203160.1 hypothetical protein [Salmonella enterica]MBK4309125.1 hypothetical protein [Enterobacter hormaechei]MBK4459460.1 hypothetical protein [Enterobacter hormaechei]MBK4592845.1 hypothetical protein [Enterobacter hormaechei]
MALKPLTHLITSCTKGKHFQCGSRAELSIRAGETPEEAMASWAATIRRSQSASPVPALSLYTGNHWSTAKEILRTTENLELWVISAGLGFLNSRDLVDAYEATFHDLPFSHRQWWRELTNTFGNERTVKSIETLMEARPFDDYVIAASPVYISAAEHDILAGASKLNNHIAQLTIVTSGAYSGSLEPYLIRSESRMMHQLSSNMVCLNIKLAQYIIGSRRISFKS